MNRQELMNECDLLQGNINRMMVTQSQEELFQMFGYASMHLSRILTENLKRLTKKELERRTSELAGQTIEKFDWVDWENKQDG
jgi:hypothetical protein